MPFKNRKIILIGTGAVAQSVAHRLQELHLAADSVFSRNLEQANAFANIYGIARVLNRLDEVPTDAFVLLALPDDVLPTFAQGIDFKGNIVAHCSGVAVSAVLSHLQNAIPISFHPLQTFIRDKVSSFVDIPIAIEGNSMGITFAIDFAKILGGNPFVLTADEKIRYHLAASIASNFLVTIEAVAAEILGGLKLPDTLLHPLIKSTTQNVLENRPQNALTGPIVRGDVQTIKKHLDAIATDLPHLSDFYRILAKETVRLALQSGRLSVEKGIVIEQILSD